MKRYPRNDAKIEKNKFIHKQYSKYSCIVDVKIISTMNYYY